MFAVYILFSESCRKYYTGHTQDIVNRLVEHNHGETKSIRLCVPWTIRWSKVVETRSEAMKIEGVIKKRGASRYLLDHETQN